MNVLRVDKNVGLMQKQGGILLYWVRTEIIFAKNIQVIIAKLCYSLLYSHGCNTNGRGLSAA